MVAPEALLFCARAMLTTYSRSSRRFYDSRKNDIFFLSFMCSPLIAVPELLVSPWLVLGDSETSSLAKITVFAGHLLVNSVWLSSQRQYLPHIRSLESLGLTRFRVGPWSSILAWYRYALLIWPIYLVLAMAYFADHGRAVGCQGWVLLNVIASCALDEWRASVESRRLWFTWGRTSRCTVLIKQAFDDLVASRDPRIWARYVACCSVLGMSYVMVATGDHSAYELPWLLMVGSLSAFLCIRGTATLASERTLLDAPMLVTCSGYGSLTTARSSLMVAIFVAANAVFLGLYASIGAVEKATSLVVIHWVSALSLVDGICRWFGASRAMEYVAFGCCFFIFSMAEAL